MDISFQLPDLIYNHLAENGPMKTSGLGNFFDGVTSKSIRLACESNPNIIGLKVRRCNYWLTKEQYNEYCEEIYDLNQGWNVWDPEVMIQALGNNAMQRDIFRGVIERMLQDPQEERILDLPEGYS